MSIRKMAVDEFISAAIVVGMEIGTILANARKGAGLQQKDVAEAMGISASYLCDLEGSRRPFPLARVKDLPAPIRPKVAAAMMLDRLNEAEQLRAWTLA